MTLGSRIGDTWRLVLSHATRGIGLVLLAALPLTAGPTGYDDPLRPYQPRSAHQAYGLTMVQSRRASSEAGQAWLAASEAAVLRPEPVELPWRSSIGFENARAGATGYRFGVAAGQRLDIDIAVSASTPVDVFVDVFEDDAGRLTPVASTPPGTVLTDYRFEWLVLEDTDYVLRVQPELERSVDVALAIEAGPALAFPVPGLDQRAILSGFGAERDGGARAHRGVDIFAERGTPAVAALDAWVTRVDTTGRGGNVVWLSSIFSNMRLYYAHLDTQLVSEGQFVLAGDVIGTIGNTGNARTTPPHLHFGVYQRRRGFRGGARDPADYL